MNNLKEILEESIQKLQKQYPNFKEGEIADKVGIARTTLNRIKNSKAGPNITSIAKIIIASGDMEKLVDVIALSDKRLAERLKGMFSVNYEEASLKRWENMELEMILRDRKVFVTYLLSGLPNGTDDAQVLEVLGKDGIWSMDELIRRKLVKKVDNRYKATDERNLCRGLDSVKHHIGTYAEFYRSNDPTPNKSYIYSLSSGLNRSGLKKVQELYREMHGKMKAIFDDKTNRGDIPAFAVGFCDTFANPEDFERERETLQ